MQDYYCIDRLFFDSFGNLPGIAARPLRQISAACHPVFRLSDAASRERKFRASFQCPRPADSPIFLLNAYLSGISSLSTRPETLRICCSIRA